MALGAGFAPTPGRTVATEHYAAQLCLNQTQNPFVRLFHYSPDPMAVTTFPEGRHLLVNASYARWLGHPVSEILGQRPADLGVVHDRRQFAQLRRQIRDRGSIQNIEIDSCFADGQTRTLLVSAELTQLEGQTCLLSVGKDITERKAIQATLTAAEARFRAIFEQMGVGVCQANLDGQLTDANPGMCRLLGYRRADLVGKSFIDITHPDDLGLDLQHYNRLLAGDLDSFTIEKRYCHRDGSHVWVALTVCLVRDDRGEPLFSIGVSQDISDRKQEEAERQAAELALQASHRRIHNILESITDAFFALDQQWRFTYLNQRAEQVLQRSRQRLLGQNLWREIPEALGTNFSKELRRAMAERVSLTVEDYMAHADSWCEFHVYPTPEGLAVYFQDVTESALIDNPKTAESMLKALRERGIQLGIDDFGTGYSSLSMVHQFPMQMLKIDRSFIHSMATDPRGVAMVQAILALAQTLGMTAIAEGVETASQLNQLQQLGCPYAQGYHFAKPLPADQAEHLMLQWPQGAGEG